MKKISLPNWVFDNLDANDNCALPNICLEMDREELTKYLERKLGEKVRIRECLFEHCDRTTLTKNKRTTPYLIAEIIHE